MTTEKTLTTEPLSSATPDEATEDDQEKKPILDKPPKQIQLHRCLHHDCMGYLCALCSAMSFTLHALCYKINTTDIHSLKYSNALFSRMLVGFVVMLPLLKILGHPFFGKKQDYKWIFVSSFLFLSSSVFYYIASSMMSFADVIAIYFTQCAPVIVIAHLYLGEHFGLYEIGIVISTLVGVILVAHPPGLFNDKSRVLDFTLSNSTDHAKQWQVFHIPALDKIFASIIAFLASFSAAGNIVVLRRLTHVSVFTINFNASLFGLVMSIVLNFATWAWGVKVENFEELLMLTIQAITGVVAPLMLIVATRYIEAGVTSMLMTVEIVFAYIIQLIFLNEAPSISGAIGAALITLISIVFGLKNYWDMRHPAKTDAKDAESNEKNNGTTETQNDEKENKTNELEPTDKEENEQGDVEKDKGGEGDEKP